MIDVKNLYFAGGVEWFCSTNLISDMETEFDNLINFYFEFL